jgi:hypothetical protein
MFAAALWIVVVGWLEVPTLIHKWPTTIDDGTFTTALTEARSAYHPDAEGWPSRLKVIVPAGFVLDTPASPYITIEPEQDEIGTLRSTVHWEINVGTPEYGTLTFTGVPYDEDPRKIQKALNEYIKTQFMPEWWRKAGKTALMILFPPLLLLIVGIALRWVGAGFRANSQMPP